MRSRSPRLESAAQLIELGDRLGEVGIDRIELLDGRKAGAVVLHDERAFADQRGADDAVDRRADGRVIEIEFRAATSALRPSTSASACFSAAMAFSFLASGAARWLVSVAMRWACSEACFEHGFCARQRRFGRLHLDLKGPRIDPVERIAGLDLAALMERALDDDARDARANFGNPRRRDAAGQFAQHRPRLRLDGDDADLGLRQPVRGGGGSRGSLQPASSGAIAASINAIQADCARSPDIESIAPS